MIRRPETETINGVSEPNRFEEPRGFFTPKFHRHWQTLRMKRIFPDSFLSEFIFLLNHMLQIYFISRSSPTWPIVATWSTKMRFLKPGSCLVELRVPWLISGDRLGSEKGETAIAVLHVPSLFLVFSLTPVCPSPRIRYFWSEMNAGILYSPTFHQEHLVHC